MVRWRFFCGRPAIQSHSPLGQRPPEDSANEGENNGPLDEIEFWNARDKSLSG